MEEVASRTIELDELRPQLRQAHVENQQLVSQLLTIKEGIAGMQMIMMTMRMLLVLASAMPTAAHEA